MKKLFMIAVFGVVAAAMPALAETNVGVVDYEVIIKNSAKGKAFFEELEKFKAEKQASLDAAIQDFRNKQKDAQAKAASMSDEKKQELGIELQNMQTDLQRKKEDAERATKMRFQTGIDRITAEIQPLVRQVALEKNLHLVLHYGVQFGIAFFHEKIDITQDVIKKYDEST